MRSCIDCISWDVCDVVANALNRKDLHRNSSPNMVKLVYEEIAPICRYYHKKKEITYE